MLFESEQDDASIEKREKALQQAWDQWQPPGRLVILRSQYHSVVRPLIRFIKGLDRSMDHRLVVLIPEGVPTNVFAGLLHNRLGTLLAAALRKRTDVVIGMVPMRLGDLGDAAKHSRN